MDRIEYHNVDVNLVNFVRLRIDRANICVEANMKSENIEL